MTLGRTLTVLGAIAVLGIGSGAYFWPRASTRTYGIPNDEADTHAFVRATAARDWVMGGFVLWAAIADDRPAMKAGLLVCTVAPLADFVPAFGAGASVGSLRSMRIFLAFSGPGTPSSCMAARSDFIRKSSGPSLRSTRSRKAARSINLERASAK